MSKSNNTNASRVWIVDGLRTPQLKTLGKPGPFHASDLAQMAGRALLARIGLQPKQLDEVILGCVAPGPDEANIARVVALRLGCPEKTPAWTVQRNCASGMQALVSAAESIRLGNADLILAGGTEAMSHHPVLFSELMVAWLAQWNQARTLSAKGQALRRLSLAHLKPVIGILRGLTDPVVGLSMGQTAENLAARFSIDRLSMDAFALNSHQGLARAIENHWLDNEVLPIHDHQGNVYSTDDGLRADSSLQKLAQLKPAFDRPSGRVTAGNSAQISDGASMLLLASDEAVEKLSLPVLGHILDYQWAGLDPAEMGLGPVHAMAPIMKRQKLNSEQIAVWEINEAFAAQVLACLKAWENEDYCQNNLGTSAFQAIPHEQLNADGGGISLGHPVGASGARIVLHTLKRMQRLKANKGMASLCIGGGQGGAMLLQAEPSNTQGETP